MKRLVLALMVAIFLPASAFALTPEELHDVNFHAPSYTGQNTCSLVGVSGTGPLYGPAFPNITNADELAKRIKDYITNYNPSSGMKDISTEIVSLGKKYNVNPALLAGVAERETGFGTTGDGRPPHNNFWGNLSNKSGYPNYTAAAEAYYKNLRENGAYASVWNKGDAASVDDIIYIATPPSDPHNDDKAYLEGLHSIMHKLLQGLGDATSGDTASAAAPVDTNGNCSGGPTTVGKVSVDGYAFPVAPQTKSGNSGLPGLSAMPCHNTSCHEDGTPAMDIGRMPGSDASSGAAVYAISDGTVDMLHTYKGIDGCYSMQFHSSKDNFWYWYGHIQNPRVANGDTVKAGTQIAEIGLRKCTGNGSNPHLHIDRGCVINGVPQKGGRGECRDPGFLPLINSLFESLPS